MHRSEVLQILELYSKRYPTKDERIVVESLKTFVKDTPECFERKYLAGHLTGSALVTNGDLSRVLLTHHKKLNKWLQLGGHADGHHRLHEVALREAHEESGLNDLKFLELEKREFPLPFDLDIHWIPEKGSVPEHFHYDLRYLLVTHQESKIQISEESSDLRWFSLEEAQALCPEQSMQRQFDKLNVLKLRYEKAQKVRFSSPRPSSH